MTVRNYTNVSYWLQRDVVNIVGRFVANGGSAIANNATNIIGMGFSVAFVSTGLYDITVSEKYQQLISAVFTPQVAIAGVFLPQLVSWTQATKTLRVRIVNAAGAVANLTAADQLHFQLLFTRTAQKPTFGV